MPGIIRRSRIGIVDITSIDDNSKQDIRYCPNCEDAGVYQVLGKRIYLPEQPGNPVIIPHDADEWLQCHACGTIIPLHEVRGEGELKVNSEFELIENPFDFGKTVIEPVGSPRKIDKTKLQLRNKIKDRKKKLVSLDPDIRKELIEGGEIISYDVIK